MKKIVFLLLSLSLFSLGSCSTKKKISYYQMRCPDLYVPDSLNQLLVWNRAFANNSGKQLIINSLEGLASGETVGQDRQAAKGAMQGFEEAIIEERKRNYQRLDTSYGRLYLSEDVPPPLPDTFLKALAKKGQLLASLEMLDSEEYDSYSESSWNSGVGQTSRSSTGRKIQLVACWRLYDLRAKEVVDIWRFDQNFSGDSNADYGVLGQIVTPFKNKKMKAQGYRLGRSYAMRICSTMVQKRRQIYVKGHKDMKAAYKLVKLGDWEGAAAIWQKNLETNDAKLRGPLLFNLAVYEEQKGHLANAETRAREAYFLNAFKPANEYYKWLAEEQKRIKNYERQKDLPWPN
ncbi:DUF6340 family protein [Saprospira sp. CCB-QB6]|uniref:DUF6340 family protein n=1 Tax=Saprospira sp. CCB-QB6 TaxID=3023936 RepID=UPI00234964EE|nr:DUF6340 family protein [Saprospira sp. CCB-QB6]WCL81473.1 DUF6340 family protein [Saprospira sp. CCB-QB6]